jgi:hypothetical protein
MSDCLLSDRPWSSMSPTGDAIAAWPKPLHAAEASDGPYLVFPSSIVGRHARPVRASSASASAGPSLPEA